MLRYSWMRSCDTVEQGCQHTVRTFTHTHPYTTVHAHAPSVSALRWAQYRTLKQPRAALGRAWCVWKRKRGVRLLGLVGWGCVVHGGLEIRCGECCDVGCVRFSGAREHASCGLCAVEMEIMGRIYCVRALWFDEKSEVFYAVLREGLILRVNLPSTTHISQLNRQPDTTHVSTPMGYSNFEHFHSYKTPPCLTPHRTGAAPSCSASRIARSSPSRDRYPASVDRSYLAYISPAPHRIAIGTCVSEVYVEYSALPIASRNMKQQPTLGASGDA